MKQKLIIACVLIAVLSGVYATQSKEKPRKVQTQQEINNSAW